MLALISQPAPSSRRMSALALVIVLIAAFAHATWNLAASGMAFGIFALALG